MTEVMLGSLKLSQAQKARGALEERLAGSNGPKWLERFWSMIHYGVLREEASYVTLVDLSVELDDFHVPVGKGKGECWVAQDVYRHVREQPQDPGKRTGVILLPTERLGLEGEHERAVIYQRAIEIGLSLCHPLAALSLCARDRSLLPGEKSDSGILVGMEPVPRRSLGEQVYNIDRHPTYGGRRLTWSIEPPGYKHPPGQYWIFGL